MRLSLGWRRSSLPTLPVLGHRLLQKIHIFIAAFSRALSRVERVILVTLAILAVVALTGLIRERAAQTMLVPESGGVYREGVLSSSARDLELIDTALTKIGLVRLGTTGAIEPALATEWEVSEDAQTLRARISDRSTAERVLEILSAQTGSGYWKEAALTIPEPQVVEFRLMKPWAGFITELVTPIFPYGPFVNTTTGSADVIIFAPNPAALSPPYLTGVEIHLFSDGRQLERALRKNSLDGAFWEADLDLSLPSRWSAISPALARDHGLFVNLRQDVLASLEVRRRLLGGQSLDSPVALRLAVAENNRLTPLAYDLAARWGALNATVIVEEYPLLTLTKTVIPERTYDLILLGIDYGPDGDLTPYWHSSQIAVPGQNLAGYRNKEIDRLLDETRRLTDAGQRQERYAAVRQILTDQAVFASLGSPTVHFARSERVKGAIPERFATATSRWTDIASWYMKEKRVPRAEPEPTTSNN